jgi:predicted AAA+ superfamily ATPase
MSSREVSFTKLLGLLQDSGNTATIVHYLDLLEEAGILCGLQKYRTSVMKKRSSPKLQVFANGIATATGSGWTTDMPKDVRGRCTESLVGAHLRNIVEGTTSTLSWWREGIHEVDFIVHGPNRVTAIVVSNGSRHHRRGLAAFSEQYPNARTLLVGESGIPVEEFLTWSIQDVS